MVYPNRFRAVTRAVAATAAAALAAGMLAVTGGVGAVAAPPAITAAATPVADNGVRDIDFNEGWTFKLATRTPTITNTATLALADVDGLATADIVSPSYDDSSWRDVTLPHDFSIEGDKVSTANNSQAYLLGGLGFYRKTFTLPASFEATRKRVSIDFEGVYQNSDVYLNGQFVGNYPSGYTGFAYDLTSLLNYGPETSNTIVVKVQNPAPSGRWYTGSGIVRPVHLVVTDPVRFVRNGISLTTPTLKTTYQADGSATLAVDANVYSDATNGVLYTKTTVLKADGTVAATSDGDPVETNPSTLTSLQSTVTVPNVKLWFPWNIGDPYQYTVRTQLYYSPNGGDGNRLVDTVDTPYGFRWFRVDPGSSTDATAGGLYVNDTYTKINGVDLHHDSGALGAASYTDAFERQWDVLKSMGVNAYRTSHNPPSKEAIQVASAKGIIVAEEAYDGWGAAKATNDFGKFFMVPVPTDWAGLNPNGLSSVPQPAVNYEGAKYVWSDWVIQEMVKRDRNEASVLIWSIGNEVRGVGTKPTWYDASKYNPLNYTGVTNINEYTEAVRLGENVKAIDPNRAVIMGGDQERTAPALDSSPWGRINQYLDGYGLNYNTATSVDQLINRFTGTFFFESESSSQTSSRGVYLDPTLRNTGVNLTPGKRGGSNYDNDFASWTMSNEYGLQKDRDRKGFAGQFIWSGFDYLGEPTPYSVYPVGVSSFGAIDTAGFPKDSYYLFRSQWISSTIEPQVHIVPGNWNQWRDGEEVEVWVNANTPTVELTLNGESLGKKSFDVKKTAYNKEYYETSELNANDKTWPTPNGNTGGYASPGATVVTANGSSAIPAGTNYGKLHLTWKVPFSAGVLQAKSYASPTATTPLAVDTVATAGAAYTVELSASKTVLKADGKSLSYIEGTVVDKDGNMVPDAANLIKFDVTGGAIVGVDNGQQESTETYKWGGVERNVHSQRSAYNGKVLAIVQSDAGSVGNIQLVASADGMAPSAITLKATADGTGTAPSQVTPDPEVVSVQNIALAVPVGVTPKLPSRVTVNYTDPAFGSYGVLSAVTWPTLNSSDFTSPGELTITGTVPGTGKQVKAYLSVVASSGRADIAANTGLGNNNATFRFSDLPSDSPLRQGALATASFTGTATAFPNNVLNGNVAQFWGNTYSRGATVLLPAITSSRAHEDLELFWDSSRTFDQIDLSFTTTTGKAIPSAFTVEYLNGGAWVPVTGLVTTVATASNAPTSLAFNSVVTDRVRVGMTNATPYTANGNIQVVAASVYGPVTTGAVVKANLRAERDEAAALTEADYTEESWADLAAAIAAADAVIANSSATATQVSDARSALQAAKADLEVAPEPAPVVVTAPAISGSPVVGQTLTVSSGTWSPADGLTFTYQWKADGAAIEGATGASFVATSAQVGKKLTVTVEAVRDGYESGSATTAETAAVALPVITASSAPTITGSLVVGSTLTASTGDWSPADELVFSYSWSASGEVIAGATGSTLALTPAQEGKAITVTVTASRAGYTGAAATSAATAAVQPAAPTVIANLTVPTVSGSAVVGKKLTATAGAWSQAGVALNYQWLANGAAVAGATKSTYAVSSAVVGKVMTVRVTASKTGFTSAVATSIATKKVAKATSSVKLSVKPSKPTTSDKVKVTVTVAAAGVTSLTGNVKVTYGKKSLTVVMKKTSKGKVTVVLPKQKKGTVSIKATYTPTSDSKKAVASGASKVLKLKVAK